MTPEDEKRIRELPSLIAEEEDNEKAISLMVELRRLLTLRGEEKKPPSSKF